MKREWAAHDGVPSWLRPPSFPSETFRYKISGGDYFSSPSCEVTVMVLLQILSYSSPWRWPRPETGYEEESSGQEGKHGSQYSAGCLAAQPQTSKEERDPVPPTPSAATAAADTPLIFLSAKLTPVGTGGRGNWCSIDWGNVQHGRVNRPSTKSQEHGFDWL